MTATAVADQVDDDVPVEPLAVLDGEFGSPHDGFRVVAVHVQHGAWTDLATSVAYVELRASFGSVVNPTWLFTMM